MTREEAIDILTDNRVFTHACEASEEEQGQALDIAIKSLEAWEKVKAEITDIRDVEAKCHDTFDDYSDGRYDVACESLRIIDKHLKGAEE